MSNWKERPTWSGRPARRSSDRKSKTPSSTAGVDQRGSGGGNFTTNADKKRGFSGGNTSENTVEKPITVQFQVHMKSDVAQNTYPFESRGNVNRVYVVGDDDTLGSWVPANAVPMIMTAHATSTKDVGVVWSADVQLAGPRRIQYRYFIGRPSPTVEDKVIIIKWEAFPQPRFHHFNKLTKAEDKNGLVIVSDTYGQYGGFINSDGGWLTTQIEVRLSFLKNPLRWWKKRHQGLKYFMKITSTDPKAHPEEVVAPEGSSSQSSLDDYANLHEENEGTLGPVTFAVLSDTPKSKDANKEKEKPEIEYHKPQRYQLQEQFGVEIFSDENIIFRDQCEDPQNLFYTIDFFAADHPKATDKAPYYAGTSHILFSNFVSEDSLVTAPIFGRCSRPIGEVAFKYLVIRPLQSSVLTMAVSRFSHYAPGAGNPTMDIAHRGMGSSYTEDSQLFRENTIESFKEAAAYGADMVEIDVQLTKDGIPVIYHDFHIKVNLRKRVLDNMNDAKDANFELNTVAVKDLNLKQLQSLQMYHTSVEEYGVRNWRTDTTAANADESEDSMPFPTLEKVLQVLDPKVGFNLEIKYPQFIDTGDNKQENESEHFFDRNNYLDTILETLLGHSGDRRIMISCFDSDACIMLKKKQCIFPVLFLTQGQTQKYPPYKDFRTLSIPAAIKFACAEQLTGICVHSEDLLRDSSAIFEAKHAGLALICWGDDNNKLDNVQYLKAQGVDGVICNRINELISPEKAALASKIPAKSNTTTAHHKSTMGPPFSHTMLPQGSSTNISITIKKGSGMTGSINATAKSHPQQRRASNRNRLGRISDPADRLGHLAVGGLRVSKNSYGNGSFQSFKSFGIND